MTSIPVDTAYELARQRRQELEREVALARAGRLARGPRRWSVLALLRRMTASPAAAAEPDPVRPATTFRQGPSSASAQRQRADSAVGTDEEPGRAA